jgi:hypothetical protein
VGVSIGGVGGVAMIILRQEWNERERLFLDRMSGLQDSLFSVLGSLFSVLCSRFSVLGSVIAARGGGQRLKLAERWGGRKKGTTNGTQRRGGGGGAGGGRGAFEEWRLGRFGAPAGWLRESGSGLPQSKQGGNVER